MWVIFAINRTREKINVIKSGENNPYNPYCSLDIDQWETTGLASSLLHPRPLTHPNRGIHSRQSIPGGWNYARVRIPKNPKTTLYIIRAFGEKRDWISRVAGYLSFSTCNNSLQGFCRLSCRASIMLLATFFPALLVPLCNFSFLLVQC